MHNLNQHFPDVKRLQLAKSKRQKQLAIKVKRHKIEKQELTELNDQLERRVHKKQNFKKD